MQIQKDARRCFGVSARIGDQMVAAMGVLRAATDFRYQTALDQRYKTRSGSARRQSDSFGDLGC